MVRIVSLKNASDVRGAGFSVNEQILSCLSVVRDAHVATILPGCIRGNHFHRLRRKVLLVYYQDACTFGWDEGEGTLVQQAHLTGQGAVAIDVQPLASYAIRNDGDQSVFLIGLAELAYDRANPDVYARTVLTSER